jgi:hypothetical protein
LAASDIFFLPSKMEGISLAIYEAMSMGVVPVGADVGGQRELVTPDCGVLVERGSHRDEVMAYSGVLESLLRSPERSRSLGKAARDRVSTHFRLDQMGERMDHLLKLAQRSHRPPSTLMAGTGLATEHAVLAVECERISQAADPLWKYQKVESALWRISRLTSPLVTQVRRLAWYLGPLARPVRKVKDAIWIVGHRLKARMLEPEEHE